MVRSIAGGAVRWGGVLTLVLMGGGCSKEAPSTAPIRLIDGFSEVRTADSPELPAPPAPTAWHFAKEGRSELPNWSAGPRASDLSLTDEGLSGRSSGPSPTVVLSTETPSGVGDRLEEVVIRARVSEGRTLSLTALGPEGPPTQALVGRPGNLTITSPVVAGADFQTYSINLDRSFSMGPLVRERITRFLLRPTDVPGADFTIESVRLVFRTERLAEIQSGFGWHGLSQVWRETLISRAPETLTWDLELPESPWMDLALGTLSEGVTFEVSVVASGVPETRVSQTLDEAESWREWRIDLESMGGRSVELTLAARGEPGALAYWGSPVVRSGAAGAEQAANGKPKGVIVILADTLRKHHLGMYGYERDNTPHLGRLASEGTLFEDAISQGTWTKVSVPAILSSTYLSTHGVVTFNDRLSSAATTMAESFQNAGYATWASSSVAFSGQLTNLHQGVEVLYERSSLELPDEHSSSKTGREFINRLEPWLERHRDVPFFAFIHAMDPHSPFRPYPPFDETWTTMADGERYERELDAVRDYIEHPLLKQFGMPTAAEMQKAGLDVDWYINHEKSWYDASILALDAQVGRLFETLDRLGLADDTVVALVSDHGEEFLEHGKHWHGLSVYSEMVEVPLALRWPGGVPAGVRVGSTVQTIDLLPTLLGLSGLPTPETVQGRNLAELWGDGGARPRPAFVERVYPILWSREASATMTGSDSLAVVESEWKLIRNVRQGEGAPEFELYHRPSDPMDQVNVAGENPEIVARLTSILERWHESALAARLPTDDEAAQSLSAEDLEKLKSLGYL